MKHDDCVLGRRRVSGPSTTLCLQEEGDIFLVNCVLFRSAYEPMCNTSSFTGTVFFFLFPSLSCCYIPLLQTCNLPSAVYIPLWPSPGHFGPGLKCFLKSSKHCRKKKMAFNIWPKVQFFPPVLLPSFLPSIHLSFLSLVWPLCTLKATLFAKCFREENTVDAPTLWICGCACVCFSQIFHENLGSSIFLLFFI